MSNATLCVVGALGRMGRRLVALADDHALILSGALVEPGDPGAGQTLGGLLDDAPSCAELVVDDDPAAAMAGAGVVVDFALVEGFATRLDAAVAAGAAYVCGTTGLGADAQAALATAAEKIPVLWAPNMSSGVNLLLELVERAARALPGFEVEVHEIHHHHKADAPSGTAVALAERVRAARDLDAAQLKLNRGPGARSEGEVGVVASRGGEVVGEHTVYLFGAGERLELVHRAADRDIFVRGALRAAAWIAGKPAGRYTMADVLGADA